MLLKPLNFSQQDAYEGTSEVFKPVMDVQKSVKQSIDDKQDTIIEQLQKKSKSHYQWFRGFSTL